MHVQLTIPPRSVASTISTSLPVLYQPRCRSHHSTTPRCQSYVNFVAVLIQIVRLLADVVPVFGMLGSHHRSLRVHVRVHVVEVAIVRIRVLIEKQKLFKNSE